VQFTQLVHSSGFLQLFQNEGKDELKENLEEGREFNELGKDAWNPDGPQEGAKVGNIVTNEVLNLMEFLQLLSACCEGKSDLAEQKCQNEILTLENSDYIILNAGKMWPLKKTLVEYVLHTFIDSGDRKLMAQTNDPEGNLVVWRIAETLLDDMRTIVDETEDAVIHFPHGLEVTLRDAGNDCAVTAFLPLFHGLFKRKSVRLEGKEPELAEF